MKKESKNLSHVFDELSHFHANSGDQDEKLRAAGIDPSTLVSDGLQLIHEKLGRKESTMDKIYEKINEIETTISQEISNQIRQLLPNVGVNQMGMVYRSISQIPEIDDKEIDEMRKQIEMKKLINTIEDKLKKE